MTNAGKAFLPTIAVITLIVLISCMPILYTGDEPGLILLDNSNFTQNIFHKNNAFIVEFYNSWCGHCQRFAPTWKSFARDVRHWHTVVKVAAVDCAEESNVKLCSEYYINLFPSIRYFWPNYDIKTSGQPYSGNIGDINAIKHDFLDYLHRSWSQGVPDSWPNLNYFDPLNESELASATSLASIKDVLLIVEGEKSYLGREVILDLSNFQDKFVIRRIKTEHSWLKQLNEAPLLLPIILKISNDGKPVIYKRANELGVNHREAIVKVIMDEYNLINDTDSVVPAPKVMSSLKSQIPVPRLKVTDDLHIADLYLSIRETLYKQIPLHKNLESEKLIIVKNFIQILEDYFPFDHQEPQTFISMLSKWLSTKVHGLEIDEFVDALNTFNANYPLPKPEEWQTCKGSEPGFRGYPCSLWLLFHTLTVNEFLKTGGSSNQHTVLHVMRDYITNFFSCGECAKHFGEMSQNMESSLIHPNSSILWLWKAHNIVNKRLAKDLTEDPSHPKVIYPPETLCSDCWISSEGDREFNETSTFAFLVHRYHGDNLISYSKNPSSSNEAHSAKASMEAWQAVKAQSDAHDFQHTGNLWTWPNVILNRMDISLCLFLYILTSCMLLTFCFILSVKKRRRKDHKTRYPMNP